MRETTSVRAPDGLAGGAKVRPAIKNRAMSGHPGEPGTGTGASLATAVLAHLPLAIVVIDADLRLLYRNDHAAALLGTSPLAATETPALAAILTGIAGTSAAQRDRIVEFCASQIAIGEIAVAGGSENAGRLRLARGRAGRLMIQVRGLGGGAWMLVVDDGTLATESHTAAANAGDAWLDTLTGLGNRRYFNQVLQETLDNATAENRHAILLLDLDRFAPINDTLGHPAGDALLCLVAQRLRRELRDEDLLVRLGGDEFAILIQNGDSAAAVASRVGDMLSRPFLVQSHVVNIGASLGIVLFPARDTTADDLMRHADLALYDAKSAGRNIWRMFEPAMAAEARARRAFETDLRKAQALGEFSLMYQAQLNVGSQTVTGFEALLRWTHPIRGSVSPVEFIPVAEDIGCIVSLGEWVLKMACSAAVRWPDGLSVAVNVSPRQFEDSDRLFAAVQAALQASGLPPNRLELEITESSLLAREAHVLETLHRLRACGIRIAMDDFGTGYSSLSQLVSFPFDKIKIDRSFIAGLGRNADATAVLRAIAALGSGLGMTTTAEGVETAEQAALVAADGCTDIQGYLIGRPIPASEIDVFLRAFMTASRHSWMCPGLDDPGQPRFAAKGPAATPIGLTA